MNAAGSGFPQTQNPEPLNQTPNPEPRTPNRETENEE